MHSDSKGNKCLSYASIHLHKRAPSYRLERQMTAPYPAMTDKRGNKERRNRMTRGGGMNCKSDCTNEVRGGRGKKKLAEPQMERRKEMNRMK